LRTAHEVRHRFLPNLRVRQHLQIDFDPRLFDEVLDERFHKLEARESGNRNAALGVSESSIEES